jgi:hypothetical protein
MKQFPDATFIGELALMAQYLYLRPWLQHWHVHGGGGSDAAECGGC